MVDVADRCPRIRIEGHRDQELIIEIPRRGWGFDSLFLFLWLCGWTAGMFFAFLILLRHPNPFLVLWLLAAVFGEMVALYAFLWPLLGREVIGLNRHVLVSKRRMLGITFTRHVLTGDIEDIRVEEANSTFRGSEQLVVQTEGERIEIGEFATDEEREYLAERMSDFLRQMPGDRL